MGAHPNANQIARVSALLVLLMGGISSQAQAGPERGTLWIVHPQALTQAANKWMEYRTETGWKTSLVPTPCDGSEADRREELAHLIRTAQKLRSTAAAGPFCVLLLGDSDSIPAFPFIQHDPALQSKDAPTYISDHPYRTDGAGGERPLVALGRVPARTNQEALKLLRKIQRYERQPAAGTWRNRIVYAASTGRFGLLDAVLEGLFRRMVDEIVPDSFDLSMLYANPESIYCPPPEQTADALLAQLGSGALLFNYIGHGKPRALDSLHHLGNRYPILRVRDLDRLEGDGRRMPLALLSCCSTGWFDLENGEQCLAEALLFHESGPIGVVAGSRITHPYGSALLQKDFSKLLLVERVETLGELELETTRRMLEVDAQDLNLDRVAGSLAATMRWHSSLEELRVMHARLYNLLGDPALQLALPPAEGIELSLDGDRLLGTIEALTTGRAVVRIETSRESLVGADRIQAVNGPDDEALPEKAAHNYPLVNDRCLRMVEAPIRAGRFELSLRLPDAARVIKVLAIGTGDKGEPVERVGSLRLSP